MGQYLDIADLFMKRRKLEAVSRSYWAEAETALLARDIPALYEILGQWRESAACYCLPLHSRPCGRGCLTDCDTKDARA